MSSDRPKLTMLVSIRSADGYFVSTIKPLNNLTDDEAQITAANAALGLIKDAYLLLPEED